MKSNKYDLVELKGKIGSDEPVFLLRAQDITAPKVIRFWAQEQRTRGGDQKMADAAELVAEQMTAWQQATGKVKLADGPRAYDTRETSTESTKAAAVEIPSGVPLADSVIAGLQQQLKDREIQLGEALKRFNELDGQNRELKNTVDRLTSEKMGVGSGPRERPALGGMSISSASNEAAKTDTIPDQSGKPVDVSDSPMPRGSDAAASEKPAPETQPATATETASSPNAS